MTDPSLRDRYEVAVTANARDLLRYFERRLEQPADAADALSDAFLAAWRNRHKLPADPLEARMWLFGVARNVHLNARRGSTRRTAALERVRNELEVADAINQAEVDDSATAVREAIASLPEPQAELVRLVHWDGFKLVEAAQILGVSPSTTRSRYAAARATLRELLQFLEQGDRQASGRVQP